MFNKRNLIDAALIAAVATLSAKLVSTTRHQDHLSGLLHKSNDEGTTLWLENMELKTQIAFRDIALKYGVSEDSMFTSTFFKYYD